MKLLRVGPQGAERPVLLDEQGQYRDLSGLISDCDGACLPDLMAVLQDLDPETLPR